MAANYTASTITIFLNVVGRFFWRLNSFLIQKHSIKKLNFHVTCSYGECKNKTLTMRKFHKNSMWYFHHCSYIGLLCISQICMNAVILHNDNARIVILINILIIYFCSFGIDVATP